jgi:hypothetical protein
LSSRAQKKMFNVHNSFCTSSPQDDNRPSRAQRVLEDK